MSTTHPCPSCGWTLRWAPEQSSWACDRCGTVIPTGQPQQQQSGLAQQRPVATSGGSFGGSAAQAQRTPSQPPVDTFGRSPSQPPVDTFGRSPSQPPGVYQRPPTVPPSYGNAGFGGAANAAGGGSQFGMPAYAPPQAGGFGGSAGGAQPQRPQTPSSAPPYQQPPQQPPVQPQPQPGYGPGGYPSYTPPPVSSVEPAAPPKAKSKRGLVIALGAAAAIIVGVVIAVVVGKGGGTKPGLASADEVTNQTIAAMTAGDVDRLVALISTEYNQGTLECGEGSIKLDLPKALADQREMLGKLTSKSKGLTVELVKLGMPKTMRLEKGKEIAKGCKLTTDGAMHEHDLSVKVKYADKPARDRTYKIVIGEADGRWFLATPPAIERPGDCTTAMKAMLAGQKAELDKQKLGDAARARLEKAAIEHCTEDAWPDEVVTCFEDAKGPTRSCAKQLTVGQAEKLDKHLSAIIAEDVKSREVPTVASDTPTTPTIDPTVDPTKPVEPTTPKTVVAAGSGSGSAADEELSLPPICDDYKAEIEKLAGCRRIKADIRAAQRERYDTMIEGWNRVVKKTSQLVTSMETICKAGVTTLVDLRKTSCR